MALVMAFWAFNLKCLSHSQLLILSWILPLASGFSVWSFSGSITAKARELVPGLIITATGGFGVWLITSYIFIPKLVDDPQCARPNNITEQTPVNSVSIVAERGATIKGVTIYQHGMDREVYEGMKSELDLQEKTLRKFFEIVQERGIPKHEWGEKIRKIANNYNKLKLQVKSLSSADPKVEDLRLKAIIAVENLDFETAKAYLLEAKSHDLRVISNLSKVLAQRKVSAAQSMAASAEILKTELNYQEATNTYKEAIEILPAENYELLAQYKHEQAVLFYELGDVKIAEKLFDEVIKLSF